MIKEIKYNGYTAIPSDYESPDGDLAALLNLVPDNGTLKPMLPPTEMLQLVEGETLLFIHKTAQFTHYITYVYGSRGYYSYFYYDSKNLSQRISIGSYMLIPERMDAMGNTLMVFTTQGIMYFLWKDNGYHYLGSDIPEVDISFGLDGEGVLWSETSNEGSSSKRGEFLVELGSYEGDFALPLDNVPESAQDTLTNQVMSKVNLFINEQTVEKDRFCFPFFVRYALRLYDGSHIHHSAPVLMLPSTGRALSVLQRNMSFTDGGKKLVSFKADMFMVSSQLNYMFTDSKQLSELDNWKDIVTGIDIFISKPIYTHDQSGKIKHCNDKTQSLFFGKLNNVLSRMSEYGSRLYAVWEIPRCLEATTNHFHSTDYSTGIIQLPQIEKEESKATSVINSTSLFYHLSTIENNDASTLAGNVRLPVSIDKGYTKSLAAHRTLQDDYRSHDKLYPSNAFIYNNRVNFFGIRSEKFKGFPLSSMLPFVNGKVEYTTSLDNVLLGLTYTPNKNEFKVVSCLKVDNEDVIVECVDNIQNFGPLSSIFSPSNEFRETMWSFYPDVNAYVMYIQEADYQKKIILKPHETLEGSRSVSMEESSSLPQTKNTNIELPNKLYTSDVNNPFRFDVTNINTIGTGTILGLSSAAKALSQGQFGQFPLYAFTTEGIWALEVSTTTGAFSARQPITRDVCINHKSITQIDSAVLFATDRGIMLLSGSESRCISDVLNAQHDTFSPLTLPASDTLITSIGFTPEQLNVMPFPEFIKDCGILYDYTHQRFIVHNPACHYAYVYSIKDKSWGMLPSNISSGLNSYPEALAVTSTGSVVNFSDDDVTTDNPLQGLRGLLFTRPFKLDAPDMLKTIDTIIQRGNFQSGHVSQVLYGSRDLCNWTPVWSSTDKYLRGFRGTPYKFYRLAILCHLDADESLSGCTIQYTPRQTNKLR